MPRSKKPGWVDWRKCPARAVIIRDLEPGGRLHQCDDVSAEEIFRWYENEKEFENVVFSQFKARLATHRKAYKTKELHAGWINWKTCPAREIVMSDLRPGGALYQRDNITAEEIFPWYQNKPGFEKVVFSQFKARLATHRQAACVDLHRAVQSSIWSTIENSFHGRPTTIGGSWFSTCTLQKNCFEKTSRTKSIKQYL